MADKKKILLPILVIVLGLLATVVLVASKPDVETETTEVALPSVRTLAVTPTDVPVIVRSQGEVRPRTEAVLVAEVGGRIQRVTTNFESGAFVRLGQPLVWIDPRDFEAALAAQRASLAQAEVVLEREQAEAEVARKEWDALGRDATPNPLVLRQPQLQEAAARVEAAKAAVQRAELDLERTVIRAPFTGRIRSTAVDLGGFAARGTPVATVYSVRDAEIRLPVQNGELAFLDDLEGIAAKSGAPVTLSTRFAGQTHSWEGTIVRSEGEIDAQTRMIHLVAQVADPYGLDVPVGAPLAVGLFVDASIQGNPIESAYELPRSALRRDGTVMVVEDGRLRARSVDIARTTADHIVVRNGLEPGDQVAVSKLGVATEGMRVEARPIEADANESFETADDTFQTSDEPTEGDELPTAMEDQTSDPAPEQVAPGDSDDVSEEARP